MKAYISPNHSSYRIGCVCCVPNKSGDGHYTKRKTQTSEAVKRNGKKAARREAKKAVADY